MSSLAPLVSVIITTCDRPALLRSAIDSVLGQTYVPREVIVVDGGSKEDAGQIIAGSGPEVKHVRQQKAFVSVARNKGLAAASGEWIAFLDDDDRWQPEKLAQQMAAIGHLAEPVLACANGWKGGRLLRRPGARSGFLKKDLLNFPTPPSSWLINRRLVDAVGGFDESYNGWEDVNFLTRVCSRRIPIYYISQPLVTWNDDRGRPRISELDFNKLAEREKNLRDFLDYIKTQRRYYFRYLYSLGKDARSLSDRDRAKRYFQMALAVEPWHPGLFVKYLKVAFF